MLNVASTARNYTLCIPLGHFFQAVSSYDKLIYNMNFDLRLTRNGSTNSIGALGTTSGGNVGRLVHSQVANTTMGFQTLAINWVIPQYRLTEKGKSYFLKASRKS